ncbi:MAG: hypothetical protein V4471_02345 [Pseudomonadota bacterium]
MTNKLPLTDMPQVIAKDLKGIETQYKEIIEFYLANRIYSRTFIAGSVGQELEMGISTKAKLGISGAEKAVKKGAPLLVRAVAPSLLAIEITVAVGGLIAGTITTGGIATVVLAATVTGGVIFAENRNKNKIRAKAKTYRHFFPRDKSIIELFSQLVTLSVAEELQTIQAQPGRDKTIFASAKESLHNTWKVVNGTKVKVSEEEQKIKLLAKQEVQKIWEIFKNFARQPEKYAEFANSDQAKKMLELFEKGCDFGDKQDTTKVVNDWKLNVFWLNVFACYLEDKDVQVRESVVATLGSTLNALVAQQASTSVTEVSTLQTQVESLQEQLRVLQQGLEVLQAKDNTPSSSSQNQDSLSSRPNASESASGARKPYTPVFFSQRIYMHAQPAVADLQVTRCP